VTSGQRNRGVAHDGNHNKSKHTLPKEESKDLLIRNNSSFKRGDSINQETPHKKSNAKLIANTSSVFASENNQQDDNNDANKS